MNILEKMKVENYHKLTIWAGVSWIVFAPNGSAGFIVDTVCTFAFWMGIVTSPTWKTISFNFNKN